MSFRQTHEANGFTTDHCAISHEANDDARACQSVVDVNDHCSISYEANGLNHKVKYLFHEANGHIHKVKCLFHEANGLIHTSPGQRPGSPDPRDPQPERLHHYPAKRRGPHMKQAFSLRRFGMPYSQGVALGYYVEGRWPSRHPILNHRSKTTNPEPSIPNRRSRTLDPEPSIPNRRSRTVDPDPPTTDHRPPTTDHPHNL